MADPKDQQSQQQSQQQPGGANKAAGELEPGESNARAVRNTEGTAGGATGARTGRAAGTAGATDAAATGATTDSATGPVAAGQRRVRMMRTEGERRVGQILVLPQDEADRLLQSGAAEAVQTS